MGAMDAKWEFSDAQVLTSLSDTNSNITEDVTDLGADGKDGWGNAKANEPGPMFMTVQVNKVMTGAGAKVQARLMTHTGATVTSGTTIMAIEIPALSKAGWRRTVRIPDGQYKRYVGGDLYIDGGTLGATNAFDWWCHAGEGDTPIIDTL